MSIDDRDYVRNPGEERWRLPWFPMKWITIAVTVFAFLVQSAVENGRPGEGERVLLHHLALSLDGVLRGEVWQPVTYLLLHGGLGHLFFNMMGLFVFATVLEDTLSGRMQGRLYLFGGLAGAAGCLAWSAAGLPLGNVPVVGASGAVTALMVAAALRSPKRPVLVFLVPVPLWILGALFLGLDAITAILSILDPGSADPVAVQAHLGGAAAGAIHHWRSFRRSRPRPTAEGRQEAAARRVEDVEAARVDALLERIHASGIGSLNDEEREFLNRVSRRYRDKSG